MELVKPQPVKAQIQGQNFQANLQRTEDSLTIKATEFVKKTFYSAELTNDKIQKLVKCYSIIKSVKEVFQELTSNRNLRINDQQSLVAPIQVIYRGRKIELNVEIPLIEAKLNQEQKTNRLFETIQRSNNLIKAYDPRQIFMRKDQTNIRHLGFQVKNDRQIKMLNHGWCLFHHYQVLPNSGIYQFELKVINNKCEYNDGLKIGICGKNISLSDSKDVIQSEYFMGLDAISRYIFNPQDKKNEYTTIKLVLGQNVFKVLINMDAKRVQWFVNCDAKARRLDFAHRKMIIF